MNENQRQLCAELKILDSERAADWLMSRCPIESIDYGEAFLLIPHRSWKRSDQKRLAKYYFEKLPFYGLAGYEAFASFMSVKNLLVAVKDRLPMSSSDEELLLYYLIPILHKSAKNKSDLELISGFLSELQSSNKSRN